MNHIIQGLLNKPLKDCEETELRLVEIIRNYPEEEAILITKGWIEAMAFMRNELKSGKYSLIKIDSQKLTGEENEKLK